MATTENLTLSEMEVLLVSLIRTKENELKRYKKQWPTPTLNQSKRIEKKREEIATVRTKLGRIKNIKRMTDAELKHLFC